jgi:uncharacterized membrane protein YeaQ/YmgE (transglycosylase-associated protein family)
MNIEELIILLAVGGVAGWLAGLLMKKKGFGLPINIIVGIIGAVVGRYAFDLLDISIRGLAGSLVSATVGAVILLFVIGLIKKA